MAVDYNQRLWLDCHVWQIASFKLAGSFGFSWWAFQFTFFTKWCAVGIGVNVPSFLFLAPGTVVNSVWLAWEEEHLEGMLSYKQVKHITKNFIHPELEALINEHAI